MKKRFTLVASILFTIYALHLFFNQKTLKSQQKDSLNQNILTVKKTDNLAVDVSEPKQRNDYKQALANIEHSKSMSLQDQANAVFKLTEQYPKQITEHATHDITIKLALNNTLKQQQYLNFEKQLNAIKHILMPLEITEMERYFYAQQYFNTAKKKGVVTGINEEKLAVTFLTDEQKERTLRSIQTRKVQSNKREHYQESYQKLLKELAIQRKTSHSKLTEEKWLQYQEKQIKAFRLNFFSH